MRLVGYLIGLGLRQANAGRTVLMEKIYDTIVDTVGNTPLVRLHHLSAGLSAEVLVKIEFANPLNSVKDRIGKAMIDAAERDGKLTAGGTVIEPTSGNTGIGLAFVCAQRGYRLILTLSLIHI